MEENILRDYLKIELNFDFKGNKYTTHVMISHEALRDCGVKKILEHYFIGIIPKVSNKIEESYDRI